MRSVFPYPGSKWRLMSKYIALFPHHNHFVDVFGGSGAAILSKPRSRLETFNDIDPHICNVFGVARDGKLNKLKHLCEYTPNRSRRFYEEARTILHTKDADPVRSAWAFLYVASVSKGNRHPSRNGAADFGFVRQPHADSVVHWDQMSLTLERVHSRFRHVQLTNWSWERCLDLLDTPTTFFFCDPSYYPPTLNTASDLYGHVMSISEHHALLRRLKKIKGKAFLCGYPHRDYDAALKGWATKEFKVATNMGRKGRTGFRIEKVWMNYEEDQR